MGSTMTDIEAYWAEAERCGDLTGHVVCRCPRCLERCLVAYRPKSQPWPPCRVCLPQPSPRVQPVGDPSQVANKRPGQPRTLTALRAAGCVVVRPVERPPGSARSPAEPDDGV